MKMRLHANIYTLKILLVAGFIAAAGCIGSSSMGSISVPARPTGVNAIAGAGQITITWSSVNGASSYNVYRGASGVSKVTGTKIASVVTRSYLDSTGLVNGSTYYYVVTAVNSAGESSESLTVSAKVPALAPPMAVSAVAGDQQVTLSWNAVSMATSYTIYGSDVSPVTKGTGTIASSLTTTYLHSTLTNGTPYYYVVTALNASGESSESSEVSATPVLSPGGTVTISGTIEYQDKVYGSTGFTGSTPSKAVRFSDVDVVAAASPNAILASGITKSNGSYLITLSTGTTADLYIRVQSTATITGSGPIEVKNLSGQYYGFISGNFAPTGDANVNVSIPVTSTAAGAFNILDVLTSGYQFINSLSASSPPALAAYWQTPNTTYGTWYCNGPDATYCPRGSGIYVYSNPSGDTDEYDDDVIWHEFGHFTTDKFSNDQSPGGAHSLSNADLDLRLTWSEGWGDFFPGAIKNWLSNNDSVLLSTASGLPTYGYVDTAGAGALIYFDFESAGPTYKYASSEVAVANVLLNVQKNPALGMGKIWDVVTSANFMSVTPINLETFWDAWGVLYSSDTTTLNTLLANRSILYSLDGLEGDNDFSTAQTFTINTEQNHTLYGNTDADYVKFNAVSGQQYSVSTLNLFNGADTFITIYYPDKSSIVRSNDNSSGRTYFDSPQNCDYYGICHENTTTLLGSSALFTATSTSTYYVKINSSSARLKSAGKYGSYTLKITSP